MLTGTVIGVSDTEVTVDLKSYTDGVIKPEDYSDDPSFSIMRDVQVGDEVRPPSCARTTDRDISCFPERLPQMSWPGRSCRSTWMRRPCWT